MGSNNNQEIGQEIGQESGMTINTPLLDNINSPADLRKLPESDLEALARELRDFLLHSVSQSGGHFAAGLGTIELTVALHYLYNTP